MHTGIASSLHHIFLLHGKRHMQMACELAIAKLLSPSKDRANDNVAQLKESLAV
jgi:hypothetical protein